MAFEASENCRHVEVELTCGLKRQRACTKRKFQENGLLSSFLANRTVHNGFLGRSKCLLTVLKQKPREHPLEVTTRGFLFLFQLSFFPFYPNWSVLCLVNLVFSAIKIYIVFPKELPVLEDY